MSTILILGATSAVAGRIARYFAEEHQESNHHFFLVGRRDESLQALSSELVMLGHSVAGVGVVDFMDIEATGQVIRDAYAALGSFDYALIAHGMIGDQLLSESQVSEALHIVDTNYRTVVAQLVVLHGLMSSQFHGKIGVITSVAGDRGRPRNFTYGSAKGALHLYLQGMRSVAWGSGLQIYTFKLGPVDSPMTVDHEKNFSFTSVDDAARHIYQAFESRRYVHYVPGYWAWVMWVVRWLPERLFQKLGFLSDR
ncbi:hypothetical protein A9Q99_22445 [Gammaproteobacteria bacterium 45_16_T64]|nr:hypothetical protein A9Q99_22445 [Gammaproteobacteria bacterium 45_16_T64]